jgi:hypothetical protein
VGALVFLAPVVELRASSLTDRTAAGATSPYPKSWAIDPTLVSEFAMSCHEWCKELSPRNLGTVRGEGLHVA